MASPDKKAFLLRIDPALWAEIERLAAQELRSANAQAEYLLRDSLARRGRGKSGGGGDAAKDDAKSRHASLNSRTDGR
jgi:hypothetical protein